MPPINTSPKSCTHERGPGVSVCLRCRHEERARARMRMTNLVLRGSAIVVVLAAIGVATYAFVGKKGLFTISHVPVAGDSVTPPPAGLDSTPITLAASPPLADSQPVVAAATPTSTPAVALAPVVPLGRTALSDTVYAVRSEQEVRVFFDTPMGRTRKPEKFELMVRQTLPRILGTVADSALASVPQGTLVRGNDWVADLPTLGIRLEIPGDGAIVLWPESRDGRGGPIIVSYRVTASR
jgi:hypothetical protein